MELRSSPKPAPSAPAGGGARALARTKPAGGLFGWKRRPKTLAAVVVGLVVLLAAAVILPNLPQQVRRSAAFQAVADGDYETAALEFSAYIEARPNDPEAGLQYAMVALHTGDFVAARKAFQQYAGSPVARRGNFLLGRALTQMDNPDVALAALNDLVSEDTGNAAAYLVRGVLRGNRGEHRAAREDLLQADDITRGYAGEDRLMPLAHKILLQTASHREFAAPTPTPKAPAPVEGRIGFPLGAAGFANRYAIPADAEFMGESPPPAAIPALHYANLLIQSGQFKEAESELRQASSIAPDLLLTENLRAFLSLHRRKYADAARQFSAVVERAPNSPRALMNLANAQWSENPDPARWESAAAAYDEIVSGDPALPEIPMALNNRGHLRTFGGNLEGARDDFTAALSALEKAQESGNSDDRAELARRIRFNLAVIGLAEGDRAAGVMDELEKLAEENFPLASRALVAAAEIALLPDRAARYRAALAASGDLEPLLANALHYERRGIFLRSLFMLDQVALDFDSSPESRDIANFRRARILLKLDNPESAADAVEEIENPRRAGMLRAVLAAAAGEKENALALYREALATNLNSPPPDAERAEYAESLGEWLAPEWPALADLDDFPVEYYPRIAALAARAITQSDPEEAKRLADLAVRVWPNDFLVLRHAGIALGEAGEAEAGLKLLERALEGYPIDEEILNAVQNLRSETGDREGSLRAAETLFNLANPEVTTETPFQTLKGISKEVGAQLAKSVRARKFGQALEIYEDALSRASDADTRNALLFHRAAILRVDNRPDEAALLLGELLESDDLEPLQRATAHAARGKNLMLEGRHSEAEADFLAAAKLNPSQADYFRRAALASADPAVGLEETIRRFPAAPQAYRDLADIYRDRREYEKVIRVMRRMARVIPGEWGIYKTLADSQTAAGHANDAAVNQKIFNALKGK